MASIERVSPLAGWSKAFAAASSSAAHFAARERPFVTQIDLRGDIAEAAFANGARQALGHELPRVANTWAGDSESAALWLGPDEWLVVAPDGRGEALVASLDDALKGVHRSITEVSAHRTVVEVSGSLARLVLAKGCPLDLHESRFSPPQAAQTVLAKANVILQCVAEPAAFRLYVRDSFAEYVAQWLLDAAAESTASRSLDSSRIASRLG